jgi:hypothetical protein
MRPTSLWVPAYVFASLLQMFTPVLQWAAEHLGWHMQTSSSIMGSHQDNATVEQVKTFLEGGWGKALSDIRIWSAT